MPIHAVVVLVEEPSNTCFIATPFAKEFDNISQIIMKAANSLELQTIRTDEVQRGTNFIEDILFHTRSARIIVAVCSPEAATGKSNPNVLYELGLAHALGKPTLIMTNDVHSLPRDIDINYALAYTEPEVAERKVLILKTRNELSIRLHRMKDDVTDSAWHRYGIAVAKAKHRMLISPDFWESYQTILAFVKKIHQQFQTIDTGFVDQLLKESKEIVGSPTVGLQRVVDFDQKWANYNMVYQRFTWESVFAQLTQTLKRIDHDFRKLLEQAHGDDSTKARIEDCIEYYKIIGERLNTYLRLHTNLLNEYRGNFQSLLIPSTATRVYAQIREFSDTTKDLLIQADALIKNLVDLIVA